MKTTQVNPIGTIRQGENGTILAVDKSIDRVEEPSVPDWCSHWPKSAEQSGDFDWAAEFNF